MAATVLNLEREIPKIRAYARRRWQDAEAIVSNRSDQARPHPEDLGAFWDWALLGLLVQSWIRAEEACELTALDVLRRGLVGGEIYYMLHIKPSKYDRARVIPVGDGMGRVIADIVRQVKSFYGTSSVPPCDHWDHHEKKPRPRAPYLLQGAGHPSALSTNSIRGRLRALSKAAGAVKADGSALLLTPHDCRRMFASEHLNNNTPVRVIQALLGHASIDTVMVYAKLYLSQLVEEHRKAMRGLYTEMSSPKSVRAPTPEEWAAFSASCSLRDMGTHLCAVPTGEHCPKGLVCLGCVHAQPKKSAVPIFRSMLASHSRALDGAQERREPPGQIAARELEVERIRSALERAEELSDEVAAAIEAAGQ